MLHTSLDDVQRRHVGLIHESSKALLKLLNDILDVSKMDAGQMEVVAEPFDLGYGVRQCIRLMSPMAEQKEIALDVDIDAGLPKVVLTDGLRLRQILLNLLGNAVKFTGSGSVHLHLRETFNPDGRRFMMLTVVDTGVGIDQDRIDAVFETFAQADSTISRRFGGSGLGLSISRRLAELLGGTIDLARRPGGGTIATLKLPLVEATAHAIGLNRSRISGSPSASMTMRRPVSVLVVEDIEVNREVVIAMLTRLGHRVDIAENGAVALEMAKRLVDEKDAWDLILMDVQMPVMDGLAATRAIRNLGGWAAKIPIVGLSASAFAAEIQECLDAGMVGHAAKPIASNILESIVSRWTGNVVLGTSSSRAAATE